MPQITAHRARTSSISTSQPVLAGPSLDRPDAGGRTQAVIA
ncbi:hypothetical protein [Halosimplex carlsbadense]|nr:hypothetical protein [Halosimplex carlsbadense]